MKFVNFNGYWLFVNFFSLKLKLLNKTSCDIRCTRDFSVLRYLDYYNCMYDV